MFIAFLIVIGIISFTVLLFICVLAILSLVGGWRRLSTISPSPETVQADCVIYSFQSMRLGLISYNMIVYTKFTDEGIIISTFWPFNFMHRPFIIRYNRISDIKKGSLLGPYVVFRLDGKKISLQGECARELEKRIFSGHSASRQDAY